MPAIRRSTTLLPICLAVTVLAIIATAILLAGPAALAQGVPAKEITGLTLTSPNPGELVINWDAASPAPEDYRVIWAKSGESFRKWDDINGNAYLTSNSHTVEGVEYKVRVRARYEGQESGPWSDPIVRLAILSTPEPTPAPTPEPTAEPTPQPTAEPTPEPTDEPTSEPTPEPSVSEADGEDLPMTTSTTGRLTMGGSVTGRVATRLDALGLELLTDPHHWINPLITVRIPGGIEDTAVRGSLQRDYGGGLGEFRRKPWRNGPMVDSTRERSVFALLSASEGVRNANGCELACGPSLIAAQKALAALTGRAA